MNFTRRQLLFTAAAAPLAEASHQKRPALCLFSKHLPRLDYDQLGKACKEFGFDGIDLTVRPKGHVLPENVERDLPKAVKAIHNHGLSVPMITTGLLSAWEPAAEPTLRTAGGLGIPYFKIGYYRYGETPVFDKIATVRKDAAGLLALAKKCGITAGWHNHSGDYVGSSVWDSYEIIRGMAPTTVGYYFDPCHATAEGGKAGWQIATQLALTRLKMVGLKDFYWKKHDDGQWKMTMCPLGEGMVDWEKFFSMLATANFTGPISLHVEYESGDENRSIANDLAFMRKIVEKYYR